MYFYIPSNPFPRRAEKESANHYEQGSETVIANFCWEANHLLPLPTFVLISLRNEWRACNTSANHACSSKFEFLAYPPPGQMTTWETTYKITFIPLISTGAYSRNRNANQSSLNYIKFSNVSFTIFYQKKGGT